MFGVLAGHDFDDINPVAWLDQAMEPVGLIEHDPNGAAVFGNEELAVGGVVLG